MLKPLDRLNDFLYKIALWISVTALTSIILINVINLLMRWLLNRPIQWNLEISLILSVYSVMLIIPVICRDKEFIQMQLIEQIIVGKNSKYLNLFVDLMIIAVFIYLVKVSFTLSASQTHMLSRGIGIPRTVITMPVTIGAALSILMSISNIVHQVNDIRSNT